MARRKRSTLLMALGSVALLAVVLAGIFIVDRQVSGLRYTLLFEDARGLQAGAPVQLQGVTVGKVESVEHGADGLVEVAVRIEPRHAPLVHGGDNTSGRIHRQGIVFRSAYVELLNKGERGEGLAAGTRVRGLEGKADELLWRGGGAITDSMRKAIEAGSVQLDRLEQWAATDGADMKAEVDAYMASLGEAASSIGEEAKAKSAEAARKGRQLLDKLRSQETKDKASQAAADVRATLGELFESAKELASEGKASIEDLVAEQASPTPTPAPTPGPTP